MFVIIKVFISTKNYVNNILNIIATLPTVLSARAGDFYFNRNVFKV